MTVNNNKMDSIISYRPQTTNKLSPKFIPNATDTTNNRWLNVSATINNKLTKPDSESCANNRSKSVTHPVNRSTRAKFY